MNLRLFHNGVTAPGLLFKSMIACLLLSIWLPAIGSGKPDMAQNGASSVIAFEEVAASASGITWVHDNAMSEQRYLPETLGPGGAFFDYDNDGWMDIYLVNYGVSDFYK